MSQAAPDSYGRSSADGTAAPEPRELRRQYSWALQGASPRQQEGQLLGWGRNDFAQLGSLTRTFSISEDDTDPGGQAPMAILPERQIVDVAGSVFSSALLTGDGELFTCGSNDSGQLGHLQHAEQMPVARVVALEASIVHAVACGESHTLVVVDNGQLAACGANDFGQLGLGEEVSSTTHPRKLKVSRFPEHYVRVAAGKAHSLALTGSGRLYSFGAGTFGALGHDSEDNVPVPHLIAPLANLGVVQVSCGEGHSAALLADGRLMVWGQGKYGALGLGNYLNVASPQHVRGTALHGRQVACGAQHTALLVEGGALLSWGAGTWGQTGHGSTANTCYPQRIEHLQDVAFSQVSAGARHTLGLTCSGAIWGWGDASMGQLGPDVSSPALTPCQLTGCGRPGQQGVFVCAAGHHSFAGLARQPGTLLPGSPDADRGMGLRALQLPELATLATSDISVQALRRAVEDLIGSPAFLVAQFTPPAPRPSGEVIGQRGSHGLDMTAVDRTFTTLLRVHDNALVTSLGAACVQAGKEVELALQKRQALMPALLPVKALLILLQNPLNADLSGVGRQLLTHISLAAMQLSQEHKHCLSRWLGSLPPEVLAGRNIRPLNAMLPIMSRKSTRLELLAALHLLQLMFIANGASLGKGGPKVALSEFYSASLCQIVDLGEEYALWVRHKEEAKKRGAQSALSELVSLCQVPFVLTPSAKQSILRMEARMQQAHLAQAHGRQAMAHGQHPASVQFFDIRVRRGHELDDALMQIVHRPIEVKKPMRVTFFSNGIMEEGIDQGGVTKEFFQLVVRALFNEAYGMFVWNAQTRAFWFNHLSIDTEQDFSLVGMILGLAIYNGVILDVHFPLVVFKKLLNKQPDFQDLQQAMPDIARSMEQLLQYEGDVEATFQLSFEVEYDYFGQLRTHELKRGGSKIMVTAQNRAEYVDLYCDWLLSRSVQAQFRAFSQGFHNVCGGYALSLFRYDELERLVCGLPHLDFEALKAAARYEAGYHANHPTIQAFWRTVLAFPLDKRKRFLFFCTGCDRAPVGGLQELSLLIQRASPDSNRLPTAHTCFNAILMPEYGSEAKLAKLLTSAIENAEGFGLQ